MADIHSGGGRVCNFQCVPGSHASSSSSISSSSDQTSSAHTFAIFSSMSLPLEGPPIAPVPNHRSWGLVNSLLRHGKGAILHFAIIERLMTAADGGLAPLTEGSTRSVGSTVTHSGIRKEKRYPRLNPAFGLHHCEGVV